MAVTNAMMENGALAMLDVADAFLQVPQPVPRKISLDGSEYIILKCLPGQRDASRLWYAFFIERLRARMDITICPEQPCILKCGDKGCLLLRVDDVLILGDESWISDVLIPSCRRSSSSPTLWRKGALGACLKFCGELKHAYALIERYSNIEGKPPRVAYTPISDTLPAPSSHSTLLSSKMAAEYRTMVGIAMYMAQERFELQYATKTLASCLKTPTQDAWVALGRLVGYLRYSEQFGLNMKKACRGSTFMELHMDVQNEGNRKKRLVIQIGVVLVA